MLCNRYNKMGTYKSVERCLNENLRSSVNTLNIIGDKSILFCGPVEEFINANEDWTIAEKKRLSKMPVYRTDDHGGRVLFVFVHDTEVA